MSVVSFRRRNETGPQFVHIAADKPDVLLGRDLKRRRRSMERRKPPKPKGGETTAGIPTDLEECLDAGETSVIGGN